MIGISSSYLTNPKTLNVFMIENRKNHKKKKERKKERKPRQYNLPYDGNITGGFQVKYLRTDLYA